MTLSWAAPELLPAAAAGAGDTAAISAAATSLATGASPATARANAFVASHLARAEALGARMARLTNDPDALTAAVQRGLATLGDREYVAGECLIAPGVGALYGVRLPLLTAVARSFRRAAKGTSTDQLLLVADRLLREEHHEPRWLAIGLLDRLVGTDPERTWQLIRRAAREAGEWITIDTLAHAAGRGILGEPYRWAELEQLAYSPSRWERRLIGSTIATIPFVNHGRDHGGGRDPEIARHALLLLAQLIGDAEPDVQKALSWAYRSLLRVDAAGVEAALAAEATAAARTGDGHRAWVIRGVLSKLRPEAAAELRTTLAGIRRRAAAPSTSRAAHAAAAFGVLPSPVAHPEPPLF